MPTGSGATVAVGRPAGRWGAVGDRRGYESYPRSAFGDSKTAEENVCRVGRARALLRV